MLENTLLLFFLLVTLYLSFVFVFLLSRLLLFVLVTSFAFFMFYLVFSSVLNH